MKTAKYFVHYVFALVLSGMVIAMAAERPAEQFKEKRRAEASAKRQQLEETRSKKQESKRMTAEQIAQAKLPEDDTPRLEVKEIRFEGNTLILTEQLVADMPAIFNASDKPLAKASSEHLYDFRTLQEIISSPGTNREVSARSISGLTQYVLSAYQEKNFGGIYVYVPAEILKKGEKLKDGIMIVQILEAHVIDVNTKYYDVNQLVTTKTCLDPNVLLGWSPVKKDEVLNRKKLDDFVNLLNRNPDRYVSAMVSKGREPNTLAVNYNVYEADPWHYFIQVDNSGVKEREWNPMFGVINTNLLGYDDSFFAIYQVPLESDLEENYSLFGSYDIPITGPELRLNVYGGYSEFDLSPQTSDIDFVGGGKFIGTNLRYNVFQLDGWFFDAIGSISHEESRITPSLFPEFTASNVSMDLWGFAVDIHKRDDIASSSLGYKYSTIMGGSSEDEFTKARTGAQRDFDIHTFSGMHSRILDPNRVTRLSTTLKWVVTDNRLVPAKMTPFGGMYSVRGYDEYEIIADGGVLISAQYEFDIIRYEKLKMDAEEDSDKENPKQKGLKKLAPLVFADFGRSMVNEPTNIEEGHQTLYSIGVGTIFEYGDNFSGGVYYGYPLRETEDTRRGKGRVNVGLMLRW